MKPKLTSKLLKYEALIHWKQLHCPGCLEKDVGRGYKADFVYLKQGMLGEVEIKVSKSDLWSEIGCIWEIIDGDDDPVIASQKFPKYSKLRAYLEGRDCPNYFSYLVPEELVDTCVVLYNTKFGLFSYKHSDDPWQNRIRCIKAPKRLTEKVPDQKIYSILYTALWNLSDLLIGKLRDEVEI